MTKWHCQMLANGPDSDIDRKVVATGPSLDMASTWQEREPADVARAKGTDSDKGTITCVTDDDRGQVFLPGVVQHEGAEMTAEERDVRKQEEFSTGPLSILEEQHTDTDQLHYNLVLEGVKGMWTFTLKTGNDKKKPKPVHKDRFIKKMFLRGDSVILVVKIGGQKFPLANSYTNRDYRL